MKKLLLSLSLATGFAIHAQIGTSTTMNVGKENSRWTLGGYAGLGGTLGSGGGGTALYITPRVGYKITESFETGLAGNFTWNNSKYFSSTMIGVGPFANYYFGRNIYLTGMLQQYFINQKNKYDNVKFDTDETALYLGGGYMQRLGQQAYLQIGAMYNVLYDENKSAFSGGFIPNIGIVYGL